MEETQLRLATAVVDGTILYGAVNRENAVWTIEGLVPASPNAGTLLVTGTCRDEPTAFSGATFEEALHSAMRGGVAVLGIDPLTRYQELITASNVPRF